MRHFTKNFLNKKIALISTKRNLFNISEKGFARNFKSSNPLSSDTGSNQESSQASGETSFKIPKFQAVKNSNDEARSSSERLGDNIVLPNRGGRSEEGGSNSFDRPKRPRREEGEGNSEEGAFGDRRRGSDRFGGDFKPRRRFDDNEGGFRPRREVGEEGFRSRSDFGERRFDRGDKPRLGDREERPRFNRSADGEEGSFRPRRFDREGGDGGFRPRRFDREGGDGGFRPRRFDREGEDGGFKPRRFDREAGEGGFKPRRFDRESENGGFRPRRFDREGEEGGFKPRRFDREGEEGGFKPRRFDREGGDRFNSDRPPRRFDREGGDRFNSDRPPRRFDREGGDRLNSDRPPRQFDREGGDRPPRRFDRKTETEEKNEDNEVEADPNFNSFAKESTEGEKNPFDSNRLTLAEFKNKRKSEKVVPDITRVDDAESIMKEVDEAPTQKYKLSDKVNKSQEPSETTKDNEGEREDISFEFQDKRLDYLYGAHAVEAAVTFNFRKNLDLFVQMNFRENTPDKIKKIVEIAQSKNIKIKWLTREKLDKFTGGRPHNGLVLKSQPRDYVYIKSFAPFAEKFINKPEGNLLVLLDQIVDPQNFGSIIRSAFFLGSDALLMNKNNKPPISSTVCKVSSGASECIDLFAVKNIRKFLGEAITNGWTVVTTSIEKEHDVQLRLNNEKSVQEDPNLENEESKEKEPQQEKIVAKNISLIELNLLKSSNVILVLGSEANGITSDLVGVSNYNVYIPPLLNKELTGKHPYNIIDSLNVGVSAGIIINHIKTQLKFAPIENKDEIKTPEHLH